MVLLNGKWLTFIFASELKLHASNAKRSGRLVLLEKLETLLVETRAATMLKMLTCLQYCFLSMMAYT